MFVFNADAEQNAKPKPKRRRTAVNDTDDKINASHPEQRLERVHGKEISDCQIEQRAQRSRAGESDGPCASAHLSRDHACERNDRRTGQSWEEANRKKRVAKEQLAQSKKQNRKWRLIDVSKSEMPGAGDVIKLIAKITVSRVGQQMDEQGYSTEKGN